MRTILILLCSALVCSAQVRGFSPVELAARGNKAVAASGGGGTFPTGLGAYLRFKADTLNSTDGTAWYQWTNMIGNYGHLTNTDAANVTSYWTNNSGVNNNKGMLAIKTEGKGFTNSITTFAPPYTIFILAITSPSQDYDGIIGDSDGSVGLSVRSDAPQVIGGNPNFLVTASGFSGTNILLEIKATPQFEGGTNALYFNGSLAQSLSDSYAVDSYDAIMISKKGFGSGLIQYFEIVVCTNNVTDAKVSELNTYFHDEYGLTIP